MRLSTLPLIVLCGCLMLPAQAQDDPCAGFDWSLVREQAWLGAPGLGRIVDGEALTPESPAAVLGLKRFGAASLPHAPTRTPKPDTYAASVTVPAPAAAGLYQVTLSDEGWIDLYQGGAMRAPVAHTGKKNCPGLRKSLRFQLDARPVTILITGARSETMRIAFGSAESVR